VAGEGDEACSRRQSGIAAMSAGTRPALGPGARRLALSFLAVIYGFGFIDRVVIALVAQQLKADFNISDLHIGLLGGTAFAIVNAIASIPVARLAERRRRTLIVTASLLVASAFTALCAATTSFAQLFALRLGMAAGSAGTEAPAHSMISDMYGPARRASAISLFMIGVPIASILGSYFGGTIAEAFGWRATFLAFGVPGVIVAVVAALLMQEPPRTADSEHAAPGASIRSVVAALWARPYFRHVLVGTSLISLGSFGVNTFLPSFLARNYALGPGDAGLAFGLISGVASFAGTIIGGYGSEYMARRHPAWLIGFPGLGLIVGAPLLLVGVTQPTLVTAVPIILIGSCFFYTAMGPVITITHGLLDSRSRATGSAVFLLVVHLVGQGLGPPLAGFASDTLAALSYGAPGFAQVCVGLAAQEAGSACAAASAEGVRYAIGSFAVIYIWSGVHFALAARGILREGRHSKPDIAPTTA
jgi:predicted MFS family arabinose efflux permease